MNTWVVLLFALIIYWMGLKGIAGFIRKLGRQRKVSIIRTQYVSRTIATIWTIIMLLVVSLITGVQYEDIGIFVSSIIALLGVALFAQWSILSNLTSSIIIFFFFPFRVGNWVRIYDKDDSIEGEVAEITLFHVILKNDEGTLLTYPNSMIFQKAISIRRTRPAKDNVTAEKKPEAQAANVTETKTDALPVPETATAQATSSDKESTKAKV